MAFKTLILRVLHIAFLVVPAACQRTPQHESKPLVPPPPASGLTVEARLAARPPWLGSTDSLRAADYASDPHSFACATCHSQEREKTAKEWRTTCEASGCHERAWPKTVFHRVKVTTFFNCMNCHRPHAFRLNGQDCLSCHGNMLGPEGTVTVTKLAGVSTFPHARHKELDCGTCHVSQKAHGEFALRSAAVCNSCHHGPPPAADCATCHSPAETAGPKLEPVTLHIAGQEENRKLPFDHTFHRKFPCATCHENAAPPKPAADCVACHRDHTSRLDRNCRTCHEPPPEGVHAIDVHDTGCADCHADAGLTVMGRNRNFCLSCHVSQADHNPGKDCASCHKLSPAGAGGGR